jgi:hypothetical protein
MNILQPIIDQPFTMIYGAATIAATVFICDQLAAIFVKLTGKDKIA